MAPHAGPDPRPLRRVWIVNHYATPYDRPGEAHHMDLARQLVRRGYAVTIFAAGFSHVSGRDERLSGIHLRRRGTYEGVRFVWLRTFPYYGNTWRRQVNMLTFLVVFVVAQLGERRPDVVVGSTVHPFAALGGWIAARLRRARFVFEIRDLWPQTLVDLGALREGSLGERLLRGIEAFLVRSAASVVTLVPGIGAYLNERELPANHVVYVPNGVDLEWFDAAARGDHPPTTNAAFDSVARMRANGRLVAGYVGTLGRVNRLDILVEAAGIAERSAPGRIGVVIVGDGPERAGLLARAVPGLVEFAPAVPKDSVPALLRALDVTVVHATATPIYRYGVSFNKLFEYLAAGRPIVFACDSAYDPVASNGAGITVPPDNPAALADALVSLASRTADERALMGTSGRAYVESTHEIRTLTTAFESALGFGIQG